MKKNLPAIKQDSKIALKKTKNFLDVTSRILIRTENTSLICENKTWVDPITGMEFIWVPATGNKGFMMGSPESEKDRYENDHDETLHKIILTQGFWLGK
jgi:hypothetical protein